MYGACSDDGPQWCTRYESLLRPETSWQWPTCRPGLVISLFAAVYHACLLGDLHLTSTLYLNMCQLRLYLRTPYVLMHMLRLVTSPTRAVLPSPTSLVHGHDTRQANKPSVAKAAVSGHRGCLPCNFQNQQPVRASVTESRDKWSQTVSRTSSNAMN